MTTVSSRDYAGPADLRAMQVLAQRLWSRASYHHVGDLAWQRFEHLGREPAWRTRIWRDGEAVVGWAWLVEAGHFYFQVDPAYSVLFDEVFDWIEAASDASVLSTGVLENQPDLIAALQRRGYQAGSDAYPFNLKTARTLERHEHVSAGPGAGALGARRALLRADQRAIGVIDRRHDAQVGLGDARSRLHRRDGQCPAVPAASGFL